MRRCAAAAARGAALRGSGGAGLRPRAGSAWGPRPVVAGAAAAQGTAARRVPTRGPMQQCGVEVARACWSAPACLVLPPVATVASVLWRCCPQSAAWAAAAGRGRLAGGTRIRAPPSRTSHPMRLFASPFSLSFACSPGRWGLTAGTAARPRLRGLGVLGGPPARSIWRLGGPILPFGSPWSLRRACCYRSLMCVCPKRRLAQVGCVHGPPSVGPPSSSSGVGRFWSERRRGASRVAPEATVQRGHGQRGQVAPTGHAAKDRQPSPSAFQAPVLAAWNPVFLFLLPLTNSSYEITDQSITPRDQHLMVTCQSNELFLLVVVVKSTSSSYLPGSFSLYMYL
ncbi:hypothetical protein U9M48_006563 [Paspalum notatum var. saurae]|uniref:Uncharacterized protein n=1 Tax=Paspalum notatum var. saurae TaxID=547442 RepID=A0AAQ3Q045_PASNO